MSEIGNRNLLRAKNRARMAPKPAIFQTPLQLEADDISAAAMRKIYVQYYRQPYLPKRLVVLCTKEQYEVLPGKLPGFIWRYQFSPETQRELPNILAAWERMLFKLN